jgi:hypothetical protein
MSTFIWQDTVKVTTREMTRAQHIAAARDLMRFARSSPDEYELAAYLDDLVSRSATINVFITDGDGGWKLVTKTAKFTYQDVEYVIGMPLTVEGMQQLPTSLMHEWAKTAIADNDHFRQSLFFEQGATNGSMNMNGLPSAPAPSTAPAPAETSPQTTTIGR